MPDPIYAMPQTRPAWYPVDKSWPPSSRQEWEMIVYQYHPQARGGQKKLVLDYPTIGGGINSGVTGLYNLFQPFGAWAGPRIQDAGRGIANAFDNYSAFPTPTDMPPPPSPAPKSITPPPSPNYVYVPTYYGNNAPNVASGVSIGKPPPSPNAPSTYGMGMNALKQATQNGLAARPPNGTMPTGNTPPKPKTPRELAHQQIETKLGKGFVTTYKARTGIDPLDWMTDEKQWYPYQRSAAQDFGVNSPQFREATVRAVIDETLLLEKEVAEWQKVHGNAEIPQEQWERWYYMNRSGGAGHSSGAGDNPWGVY